MATRPRPSRAAAALAAALLCQACAVGVGAPVRPPGGALFTWVSAPVDTNFSQTPVGSKTGTSETRYLYIPNGNSLPLSFAWGDARIAEAAADAGITTVHYADYEFLNILGVYNQLTVRVSGD